MKLSLRIEKKSPGRKEEEEVLAGAEILNCERMEGGRSRSFVVNLKGGITAIYKPETGEADTRPGLMPVGTQGKREVATYIVSERLELHLVPPTVLREKGVKRYEGRGAFQLFVSEGEVVACLLEQTGQLEFKRSELEKLAVFDIIIGNTDRHHANFLIATGTGGIRAIDNGLSFPKKDWEECFYSEAENLLSGREISRELMKKLKAFASNSERKERLREDLSPYLSEKEIEGVFSRINLLVRKKRFLAVGRRRGGKGEIRESTSPIVVETAPVIETV